MSLGGGQRAAAQEAFREREVLGPRDLEVLEIAAHQPRREAGGLDGAGLVGDLHLGPREAGPQGVAQHADALCHAIIDALFGAAGLGDIGRHFPDTDAAFKGADSIALLAECVRRVRAAGWEPVNIDSTIVAQKPRLAPHIDAMRARLAETLGLPADVVNVKAKTAEKMGPVGELKAIETRAVCLLQRIESR